MQTSTPHIKAQSAAPIVFRRWSRKGYAIMASLHKHVVIGVLSVNISSASMKKMANLIWRTMQPGAQSKGSRASETDTGTPAANGTTLMMMGMVCPDVTTVADSHPLPSNRPIRV